MITIYGKPSCTYCVQAKNLCDQLDVEYEYIDILDNGITREELCEITGTDVRTVPQCLVNGHHIGGFNELKKMIGEGDV